MGALSSWSCAGCTNICYMMHNGETGTYCKAMYQGPYKGKKWYGDHIACLDYTTDPARTDNQTKIWTEPKYGKG